MKDYRVDVESIKKKYTPGMKIMLIRMKNEPQMKPGLKGRVDFIDGIGQIHMKWENGSGLALIPNEDKFIRLL